MSDTNEVTPEESKAWSLNPATKEYFARLQAQADEWSEHLVSGAALNHDWQKARGVPWTNGLLYGLWLAASIQEEMKEPKGEKTDE